ncbi:Cytochrome P450 71A1 [Vitis vinifera]|uniref:Cytochrome P450 71A1 n=1 Tax=Vitis vinifera TaxID=29760 RepID=A0A438CBZ6_VITVI|nr:Cytochrome P450 71A1 [Vitis vinifera]
MALLQWLKEGFLPSFLFAGIILVAVLKFLQKGMLRKRKFNLPPSPRKLPIIGNLHQLGNMPHISLHRLAQKFGPIIFLQLGEVPTVVVSSARVAKEVMKTHDLALSSRPQIFSAKHLFYDCTDIAFSPYSAYWRHIRKICILELLSAKRVQSFSFVKKKKLLAWVAFGRDFSAGGEYDRHGFQTMLEEYQVLLGGLVWRFLPFHGEHLDPERKKEEHKDLVDVLLHVKEEGATEMPLTMDNVKAIILDMFAAGTDTTFITLDWGMTELIMNPKVMERAQAEVRSIVGERRVVTESDLPQLHYMKAVIKEIFRLHPPAPVFSPRESMEDVTIDGYNIPAKTSTIDFKGQDFELIPFGAGRRSCPAITFGAATVELALAQLLHSFDWELPLASKLKIWI